MLIPHYQRFDSDSQTSLSITVHNLSAFTLEQSIVASTMTFTHSTAVSTPFTCMVGVDGCESDILVEASGFHGSFEEQDRHPQNLFIESSALGTESFKVLNGDVSIILDGKVCDVSDNLACPILDEVLLVSSELSESLRGFMASFVCEASKLVSSCHNTLTLNPNVLAKVELLQDFAIGSENTHRIAFAVDINADYISSSGYLSLRTIQEGNNLTISSQSIGLASPPNSKQVFVSLPVTVLSERNSYTLFGFDAQLNKVIAEGECSGISRDIEFDSDALQDMPFTSNNSTLNITNHLAIKGGTQLGS
jgi:hypothetical protein